MDPDVDVSIHKDMLIGVENLNMIWYVGGVRPQSVYNGRPELGSDCYGEPHLLSFLPPVSYKG